jgi:general stress protein 26
VTRAELLQFMRAHVYAVQASVASSGAPQAAVVGIVVTDALEIFFDTMDDSRKAANLRRNPRVAFVIGGTHAGDERTVQYEGIADEPRGAELQRLQALYLDRFPDGHERQRLPGCIYLRVRPTWIRYSNFGVTPPEIVELTSEQLRSPAST